MKKVYSFFKFLFLLTCICVITQDNAYAQFNVVYQGAASDPTCSYQSVNGGAGAYWTINVVNGVNYSFFWTPSGCSDNTQFSINNSGFTNTSGSPYTVTAGASGSWDIGFYEANTTWCNTSAVLSYKTTTPTVTQGGTTSATVCASANTYTIPGGYSTDYGTISWASTGDGTFTNGNTAAPIYNFGPNDISAGGVKTLTMTANNGGCTASTTFALTIDQAPTTASVGGTQNICGSLTSGSLGGNSPSVGTGTWTQTSGPGTTTFNGGATSPTASATATAYGTYVYTWTISNGGVCPSSSASVTVNYYATPTTASVTTPTLNVCGSLTSGSLGGNTPAAGTGTWTQQSGPGTTTFSNANSGSSTATATATGTYVYKWTIANGTCPSSSATVTVNYYATPTTASVGGTQNICGSLTSGALGGNLALVGTGAWSQTSGPGTTFFSAPTLGSSTAAVSAAGTYVFTWTITNGTCTSAASVTVNYYTTPTTATVGLDQSICGLTSNNLGGNTPASGTGAWTQTAGPGTTTFSNASSGTSTATATVAGNYTYKWTISNGTCPSSSASINVAYYNAPTAAAGGTSSATVCANANTYPIPAGYTSSNGTILWSSSGDGSFTGGTTTAPVYTFGTNDKANGGLITLTMTVSNGPCTAAVATFGLTINTLSTIATVGPDQSLCGSLTSGSLGGNIPTSGTGLWTQTAGPGTSTFSNASSASSTATATVAGSYTYTWTITNGTCPSTSASINVNYISTPTGGSIANSSYCSSVGIGSVSVTGVSNATQYAWALPAGLSGSSSTSTITVGGSVPGSYTVTVTPQDVAFGVTCSGTPVTGTVNILAQPVIDSVNAGSLSCFGGSNDTIIVYATTTNGNLFYSIDGGTTYPNSTGIFPNLGAGSYNVVVQDDSLCGTAYGANPVKVIPPPAILLSIASFSNVLCNGDSTGFVDLSASGGTGVLTFVWSNGATSQNINHLAAGTFTVTATDANGCSGVISQTISQPPVLTDSISATNISCYGANNGTATFIVAGGSPPYKYLWSTGDTSQTITNLNGAIYFVTATDNNHCIVVNSVNIANPQPVALSLAVTNVTCFGSANGQITATVTGGSGTYTYNWSPAVSAGPTVTGVGPGTYILTVSDVNNCSAVDSATVTQPLTGLSATSIVTTVKCANDSNGSINLLASGGVGGYVYNWSSGQSIQIISGLPAGIYVGSVTDANGCVATVTDTLLNPVPMVSILEVTGVTCYGASDGQGGPSVVGGVPPYTYLWTNFDTAQYLYGLSPGQYGVIVTDAYGCKQIDTATVFQPAKLNAAITVNNIACNGANNGSVVAIVTGGTTASGTYTYSWSPVASSVDSVSGVGPGTYTVTASDDNGCSVIASGTVTQPATAVSVSDIVSQITCNNANNGSITILASGGSGGYTYAWTGSAQTTSVINGLSAGPYTVTVTDGNGCTASLTETITNPSAITSSVTGTNVTCAGAANGSATLTVNGGTPGYTYLWSNLETTQNLTNIAGGLYRVIITDTNGCTHDDSVIVTEPLPMTAVVTVTNIGCNGSNTGSVVVTVSGGTPAVGGYTYTWSPVASATNSVSGVGPGTYTVTASDANGCSVIASGTVTQPATAVSVSDIVSQITCNNANNGSITILASGGSGGYTYAWTGSAQTTSVINGLSAGPYTVTVTDGNGCTASLTETITNPSAITSSVTGTNVTCAGAANGSATLTVNGGTPGYTYLWSNFETTQNLTNIAGGLYRVIITDTNGCTHDDSVIVTEPLPMTAVITVRNVGCSGGNTGSVVVTVSGGTPAVGGYTYTWSPVASSVDSVSGVGPGTYTVTASDANGCSVIASGTVTQLASTLSAISIVTDITCNNANNGSISVLPSGGSGGYTYAWTGSAQTTSTITGLSAGPYTVTVTDGNGCTASLTDTIHNPSAITSSVTGTNVTCAGAANGSATLTVNGGTPGYTYLWSNFVTTQNLTNIAGGLYRVIITDANGCTHSDSVIVTEPLPMAATVAVTNVLCNGGNNGSVVVTVSGGTPAVSGYTYTWSPVASATNSVSGVGPGTYTVTAADANGCSVIASGTVTQPASAVSATAVVTNITCNNANNGSINILASGGVGGYTYAWTGSAQTTSTISGLSAGSYTVTVTDGNGCTASLTKAITNPSAITSSVTGTNVTCAGAANGSATLTVNGGTPGYTYLWSNFDTSKNLTNVAGGLYRVIITDANGCKNYDSVIITEPRPMTATVRVSNVLCFGGNNGRVVVTVSGGTPAVGGYTYTWSPTASSVDSVSGVGPGTYTVTASDANGCSVIASGTVTQPATAVSVLSNVVNVSCGGNANGSISLSVNGGTPAYTYVWSTGAHTQNITGLTAGIYKVTVADANGCSVVVSDTVKAPVPITSSVAGTNVTCAGSRNGTATLTVSGGTLPYTFLWSNFSGSQNIDSLSGGWYYVIITDASGCEKRDSVRIFEPLPLTVSDTVSVVSCNNGSNGSIHIIATGGTGSYTYTWTPSGPNSPNNTNLSAGTYSVTVSDVNSCKSSLTVTLSNPTVLTVAYTFTNPRCNGDLNGSISLIANGGTLPYNYTWSPTGSNSPNNSNLAGGTYLATVTDGHGCSVTESIVLTDPAPMYVSGIQKNVSCHGSSDGYILPTGYGGTQPYSFQWYLGADTFAPMGPITENITQLSGGDYYLIITDGNGCRVPFTRHIKEPDSLKAILTATDLACSGSNTGSVSVSVTGGTVPYQYLWNNFTTDSVQNGVSAGVYTIVVTDSNGCHLNKSITVNQPTPISIRGVVKNTSCNSGNDGAISVTVTGGKPQYTFSWNTNPVQTTNSISNLIPGVYIVTVTDSNHCAQTDTFIITAPSAIEVNTAVSNPTCSGGDNGFVSLDVRGGSAPYLYNWSTTPVQAGNVASGLSAGVYYATITDSHGCTLIDTALVVSPAPIVVTVGAGSSTCAGSTGGVVIVNATGGLPPYSFGLGNVIQNTDTFRNLGVGTYTVVATDANGCQGIAPVVVAPIGTFTDTLTASPNYILAGETVQLYANASSDTTITSYVWYPADSLNFSGCASATDCAKPTATPQHTTDYIVTVVNARGCTITDTVHVTVSNQQSAFIPSAFSPNGDKLNDKFEFDILGATTVNVQIWDRWGELVYNNPAQANGVNGVDGWDGTFRGKPVQYDTYTYQFVVTYFDGHTQTLAGTLTVLR